MFVDLRFARSMALRPRSHATSGLTVNPCMVQRYHSFFARACYNISSLTLVVARKCPLRMEFARLSEGFRSL